MLEEVIETVVEIAADVAEAVITDRIRKKKALYSCDIEPEPEEEKSLDAPSKY